MKRRLLFALMTGIAVAQGCTTYVYRGDLVAKDSDGKERAVVLYWPKTVPLIGQSKAGPASLRTACGTPVTYAEQEEGIVFRGTPGQDRLRGNSQPLTRQEVCGRFLDRVRFVDIPDGALRLTIVCEPVKDEFSVGRAYLQARARPYEFAITRAKSWSLLGREPALPAPPECLAGPASNR